MKNGYSLIGVLVVTCLLAIVFTAFNQMLLNAGKWQRGISSNNDLDTMTTLFKLLTDTKEACARSGLIGTDLSPLLQPTPAPIPVTIRFPSGPIVFQAGGALGDTRLIKELQLVRADLVGPLSGRTYFSMLTAKTELRGRAASMKNPNRVFYLRLITDDNNIVISCTSASGSVLESPTVSNVHGCPAGYDVQSIDFANQTLQCKLSNGGQYLVIEGNLVGSPYCYTGNPVMGGTCQCPPAHVPRDGVTMIFSNGPEGNIGSNFGCLGTCTFRFMICSAF